MTDIEDIVDINKSTRIAVIDPNRCKPNKCGKPCIRSCPVVRQGKICIEIKKFSPIDSSGPGPDGIKAKLRDIAQISEALCTGCALCVKACPYDAIKVVRVPRDLETEVSHRYGPNSFKLHRFPEIKPGKVYGIIGQNGLGKSTILQILSAQIQMNLGRFGEDIPDMKELQTHFRGSSMQNFLKSSRNLKIAYKQQYLKKALPATDLSKTLAQYLRGDAAYYERLDSLDLGLAPLMDRQLDVLSGGELQRVLCAQACLDTEADMYLFDEPTSYLDLKQRLRVSDAIHLTSDSTGAYTVVVDHDLSILDYMSEYVVALYGKPDVYGVTSSVYPVAVGINAYLEGYLPKENMRFRRTPYTFERTAIQEDKAGVKAGDKAGDKVGDKKEDKGMQLGYPYPYSEHKLGDFRLTIDPGTFPRPGITVLMGENGTGKTTFANILASGNTDGISYKQQDLLPRGTGAKRFLKQTVATVIGPTKVYNAQFSLEILKPLNLLPLLGRSLSELSGGELQKVMITRCLAKNADIYLLDEPSAYLDLETRVCLAKLLKRFFINRDKIACIVDHDIVFCTYLADQLVLFEGTPGKEARALAPCGVEEGMNRYLKNLNVTIRTDSRTHRKRINKANSNKDKEQRAAGIYYA